MSNNERPLKEPIRQFCQSLTELDEAIKKSNLSWPEEIADDEKARRKERDLERSCNDWNIEE